VNRDVTDYFQLLLRKSGYRFTTSAEKEIVREIKEKTCYISSNVVKEEKESANKTVDYTLPDGNVIKVIIIEFFFHFIIQNKIIIIIIIIKN